MTAGGYQTKPPPGGHKKMEPVSVRDRAPLPRRDCSGQVLEFRPEIDIAMTLSREARDLIRRVRQDHVIDDAASETLLRQFAETLDRLREVQSAIKRDGLTVHGSQGQPRPHPLLASESALRRDLLACARALRLDLAGDL